MELPVPKFLFGEIGEEESRSRVYVGRKIKLL